jgi:hypothetical protein
MRDTGVDDDARERAEEAQGLPEQAANLVLIRYIGLH